MILVEMILYRALAAGYEYQFLDAGINRPLRCILDQRLALEREAFPLDWPWSQANTGCQVRQQEILPS